MAPFFGKDPLGFKNASDEDITPAFETVGTSLKTALGLVPLAVGVAVGYGRMRSNNAFPLSGIPMGGLGQVAADVGEKVSRVEALLAIERRKQAETLASGLMQQGDIENILRNSTEERKSLLAALLPELEDRPELREKLLAAIDSTGAMAEKDIQEVKTALKTVYEAGGPAAQERLAANKVMYGKVASQLGSPTQALKGIEPVFTRVNDPAGVFGSMGMQGQRLLSAWKEVTRKGGTVSPEDIGVFTMEEQGVGKGWYAGVIKRGKGGGQEVAATIPLQTPGLPGGGGAKVFRVAGRGAAPTTTYLSYTSYMDSEVANNMIKGGQPLTGETIRSSLGSTGGPKPMMAFEEINRRLFGEMVERRGPIKGWGREEFTEWGSRQRTLGLLFERAARPGVGGEFAGISEHLRNVAAMRASGGVALYGERLSSKDFSTLLASLTSMEGSAIDVLPMEEVHRMQLLGGTESKSIRYGIRGSATLESNSAFSLTESWGLLNRSILPVTARVEQMLREGRFVAGPTGLETLPNTAIGKSPLFRVWNQDLQFAGRMTGGMNLGVLMYTKTNYVKGAKVSPEAFLGLSSAGGAAYSGASFFTEEAKPFTVMIPELSKVPESPLLRELVRRKAAGEGPLAIRGKESIRKFFEQYGVKTRSGGAWLGNLPMELVEVPRYSDLTSLTLDIAESATTGKGNFYKILTRHVRGVEGPKLFSLGGKVGVKEEKLTDKMLYGLFARMDQSGSVATVMKQMGISAEHMLVHGGDIMKKGAHTIAHQMATGYAFFASQYHPEAIKEGLGGLRTEMSKIFRMEDPYVRGGDYLKVVTRFIAKKVGESGRTLPAEAGGLIFGGVHGLAEEGKLFGLGLEDLTREVVAGLEAGGASKEYIEATMRSASKGIGFGIFSFAAGPVASSYRATLGSMEPRTFSWLQHKLINTLKLSNDQAADFIASILARSESAPYAIQSMPALLRTIESLGGVSTTADVLAQSKLPKLTVQEFISTIAGSERGALELFEKHPEGFMLGLGGKLQPTAGIFGEAVKNVYLPGRNLTDYMLGAQVVEGEGTLREIGDEYTRAVERFAKDLEQLQQVGGQRAAESRTRAAEFKGKVANIFGRMYTAATSGKLLGSGLPVGVPINFQFPTITIPKGRLGIMKEVFKMEKGGVVFASGQTFLDSMRTYTSAAERELINKGFTISAAQRRSRTEAAMLFERFFLGMERRYSGKQAARMGGRRGGVGSLHWRHPEITPSHIALSKAYRYDFGNADSIYESFVKTEPGQLALERLERVAGKGVRSFTAMAHLAHTPEINKARHAFFLSMQEHIGMYAGEGGGRIYFPDFEVTVHYTGGTQNKYNLSRAAMQYGDFDQDRYGFMIKSPRKGEAFENAKMLSMANFEDLTSAGVTQRYWKEAKAGLKAMGESIQPLTSYNQELFENAAKEFAAKNIGPLDTSLGSLRLGILNAVESAEDAKNADRAFALLGIDEELANIKAKKLERATAIEEQLRSGVNEAIQSKGERTTRLRTLMEMFAGGRERAKAIRQVERVEAPGIFDASSKAIKELTAAMTEAEGTAFANVMRMVERGARAAGELGLDKLANEGRTARWLTELGKTHSGSLFMLRNATVIQGALRGDQGKIGGVIESLGKEYEGFARRVANIEGMASRKFLGPALMGMAGALAVGALVRDEGYSPKPLIMPGEFSDTRVSAAIAGGKLLNQPDKNIPPGDVIPGPERNIINTPINTQEMYVSKQNAWRVRGGAASLTGMGDLSGLIASMGGTSSMRINDARRPITPNYINRLQGD